MSNNIKVFNDSIGRTCFGEIVEETEDKIVLKNPATIMISPTQNNQMKVDVIPLFFHEFIEGIVKLAYFEYNKSNITVIDVSISDNILQHYYKKINVDKVEQVDNSNVVKLFDK